MNSKCHFQSWYGEWEPTGFDRASLPTTLASLPNSQSIPSSQWAAMLFHVHSPYTLSALGLSTLTQGRNVELLTLTPSLGSTGYFKAGTLAALLAGNPGKVGAGHKTVVLISYKMLPLRWKAQSLETYKPGFEAQITTYLSQDLG